MARQPRIDYPGSYHHVMNRGANHRDVFFDDIDRVDFGRLLGEIHERYGITVLAYCLMDNHYHLVIHCPNGNLSESMQHLGATYTRHVNDRLGRDGALFRGRFRSILITTDRYRTTAVRYVHLNCLDLPGITNPADYRWSSHRTYLGYRTVPVFLDVSSVLDGFVTRNDFDAFVRGGQPFTEPRDIDERDVKALVQLAIAELDMTSDGHPPQWLERTVLTLAGDELPTNQLLVSMLPPSGSQARRSARARAKSRLRTSPEIAAMVAMTTDMLAPLELRTVSESAKDVSGWV